RQVVFNLVDNAIKFTQQGEIEIRAEVEAVFEEALLLHLIVRDTGIGIPANKQQVIFEAFTQADGSTTRKFGGTGLGLAICAQLVYLMQGRIWVSSEPGKGSAFHVVVRFGLPPASLTPTDVQVLLHSCAGTSVLVMDRRATTSRALSEMLRTWDLEPIVAETPAQALELLDGTLSPIPVVLWEVGREPDAPTLAQLRKRYPQLSIIAMLLPSQMEKESAKLKKSGAIAVLSKPVVTGDLQAAILTALGRLLPAPIEEIPASTTRDDFPRRRRILLAEDTLANQRLVVRILAKYEHTVVVAGNGQEALDLWSREPFDLILMDVQMPEMDGLECTRIIRQREIVEARPRIPIIAMTAHAMTGDRQRCLQAGMDVYLAKPLRLPELYAALQNLMGAGAPLPVATLPSGEPAPSAANAPETGVMDYASALARLEGDADLLDELALLFLQECPPLLDEIGDALITPHWRTVELLAHRIKGLVDNFDAHAAHASALILERLGHQRSQENAGPDAGDGRAALATLTADVARLSQALQRLLSQPRLERT
ncbi:MAG TPA: response regulator, partial [Pirellulales bacterium]